MNSQKSFRKSSIFRTYKPSKLKIITQNKDFTLVRIEMFLVHQEYIKGLDPLVPAIGQAYIRDMLGQQNHPIGDYKFQIKKFYPLEEYLEQE
jgi:hypothetical protein